MNICVPAEYARVEIHGGIDVVRRGDMHRARANGVGCVCTGGVNFLARRRRRAADVPESMC